MFTGLIEEKGSIAAVKKQNNGAVIAINCAGILDELKPGDSVSIDGVCQTVTKTLNSGFEVETSAETLRLTTLNDYKQGQIVNLERAMLASSRFHGHIVTGHVEATGIFLKKENRYPACNFYFSAPENIMKYLVYKGSIALNGVSLTIASLERGLFSVAIIPTTLGETNLNRLHPGDKVNLEPDILGKYVEKFTQKNAGITESYLEKHGFL